MIARILNCNVLKAIVWIGNDAPVDRGTAMAPEKLLAQTSEIGRKMLI
jgi:hypothetical protein